MHTMKQGCKYLEKLTKHVNCYRQSNKILNVPKGNQFFNTNNENKCLSLTHIICIQDLTKVVVTLRGEHVKIPSVIT